jgi:hypothetical protein
MKNQYFLILFLFMVHFTHFGQMRPQTFNRENQNAVTNQSHVMTRQATMNEVITTCGPYTWPLTGETFTTSGSYTRNGITQGFSNQTAWNTSVADYDVTLASNNLGGITNVNPILLLLGSTSVQVGAPGGLFTTSTFISTNLAGDALTITLAPGVYGFGANIFAANISDAVVSGDITVTYSTGFVDARTVTTNSEFFGYTSTTPITSVTITCANTVSPFKWPSINNLTLATNPSVTLDLTVQTAPVTSNYIMCQGETVNGGLVSNLSGMMPLPNFSGDNTGGPTYNRSQVMNQGGTCLNSGLGTAVHYTTHTFTAPNDGDYVFSTCGGATFDTFLALYQAPFDPAGLCAGNTLIESNDDACGGQSTITATLVGGTTYTLVFSGFNNSEAGIYTITTSTPEPISVVPIPNFSGNNSGGPTYNRPQLMNQGGTCSNSALGTAVQYRAHTFTAPKDGNYVFSTCGGATFDTFLALFQAPFDPTGLCAGNILIESNDDDTCGAQSSITATLEGGTTYTLVVSGFSNTEGGAYVVTSTTPGLLALVEWYASSTGGSAIGTGSPFNPVGVTGSGISNTNTVGTTTFYAQFPGEICRTPADFIIAPSITINCPADMTVCEGDTVDFTVTSNVTEPLLLTQNTSSVPVTGAGIGCNPGGDNTYYRVYDLNALGYVDDMTLNNIHFSVESSSIARVVTVNAYTLTGALTNANLTLLGSTTVNVSTTPMTPYTAVMGGLTVPGGSTLVLSYSVPESLNNPFLPGANAAGQSGLTYLKAIACGINEPVSLTSIGFPNVHVIIDAEFAQPVSLVQTSGLPSGSVFPVGNHTVTFEITNDGGCTASCSFDVIVQSSPVPTGNAVQSIAVANPNEATLADLIVSPTTILWYPTLADAQAGTNALLSTTQLVSGATYYAVNIGETCPSLPLAVTVSVTLGTHDFDDLNFNYYPNPTSSILNIESSEIITETKVFNLLGQIIKSQKSSSTEVQIDLSDLPEAAYLVKIVANEKEKTIKVIKKD